MNEINPQRLWQAALGELELKMARATFDTWLRDTHSIGLENESTLVVGVKNGYAVEWLENRLYPVIRRTLTHLTAQDVEARFVVWQSKRPDKSVPALFQEEESVPQQLTCDPGLNADYTFASYVVGPSNRLAQAASQAVAESPARAEDKAARTNHSSPNCGTWFSRRLRPSARQTASADTLRIRAGYGLSCA